MAEKKNEKPNLLSAIKDGYITAVIFLHEERLQRLERMFNLGPLETVEAEVPPELNEEENKSDV
jgi:hypothetical protein